MKLKTHKETYPKFVYEFPSLTLENSFIKSNMDQFQASTNEEIDDDAPPSSLINSTMNPR
jgi:hypothetical protein